MRNKRNLLKNSEGLALIEFALILPILMLLMYGMAELTRYENFDEKVHGTAYQVTNLLNQSGNPSDKTIDVIASIVDELMDPFNSEDRAVIISSIRNSDGSDDGMVDVLWQERRGSASLPSKVAPRGGGSEVFLEKPRLDKKQPTVVVELYIKYEPFLDSGIFNFAGLADKHVYKQFIATPRFGDFQYEPK